MDSADLWKFNMGIDTALDIEYPESDGRPFAESDWHRECMIRVIRLLMRRYRDQRVYVTGNLLLYYEEGNPARFVVPDAMIVKDCDPRLRCTFKLWEENRIPCAVFETTSLDTEVEDSSFKPKVYNELGIPEYFLFDPLAEYLRPPLQGYRLEDNRYVRIEPDASGRFLCNELGLWLGLEDGELVMYDCESGLRLLTEVEEERAGHEAERGARQAAEAENKRLRARLKELGLSD
jgi:Uma2 family endonuclease